MCAYLSKAEDGTSEAKKEAGKVAFNKSVSDYEKTKAIAKAYTAKRECLIQEAVYLIMPNLWHRKMFPKVLFLNSNLPECQI